MNENIAIENIQAVLDKTRLLPTVVMWNRLEGRPRAHDFERALKAEVRDALFMLTKQWQMGEFKGDDAGSPVFAKVHMETTRLNKYQADDHAAQVFESAVPLEAKVEQRLLPFRAGPHKLSLDIRLLMGRQWLKMIDTPELAAFKAAFLAAETLAIKAPDPNSRDDAQLCAHAQVWQKYAAVAGRLIDGAELYFYLKADAAHHAYDLLSDTLTPAQQSAMDVQADRFVDWFERTFYQPFEEENDAWLPSKLEYQFACSAPKSGGEKVYTAEEYYHGHLDWYNVNLDTESNGLGEVSGGETPAEPLEQSFTYSFMPVQLQFDGMPNTRWWTFEEGRTNFGDITPDTTDINKLLLIEFGLVYANDWFLVPFTLPAGSVAQVRGMAITNVFGERIWVEPVDKGNDEDRRRWTLYSISIEGNSEVPADLSLLLLPTVPKIQEGKPTEEVYLIRDEVANMVWGIETRVPLPSGDSKPGREAALELRSYYQRLVDQENAAAPTPAPVTEYKADIRYRVMNSVPENWIPFIPVHIDDSRREIQLQRASMPRILKGDQAEVEKVKPSTKLLRTGLDRDDPQPYMVYEEEVPRAGVQVHQSYQRTRWYQGKTFVWFGARKQTGRGEGASGLAFDQIVPTKKLAE